MESSPGSASKEEGLRLLKSGQLDEAIDVLKKVAESDPDNAQIHSYLGVAYNQKGDRLHAIAEFEESLRLEESAKAYYNLGQMYESVHRVDEAIRQYRMAVDLDPSYTPAQQALAKLHSRYEAEHPEFQAATGDQGSAPEPTVVGVAPSPQGAAPTQMGYPGQPQTYGGPPPFVDRDLQKQMEIEQQRRAMMKAGLIYGMICGAVFIVMAYFASSVMGGGMFMLPIPGFASRGAGLFVLMGILAVFGAIYGGLVGLWVGTTCGGEGAGMQAGAAMGAFLAILLGVIARAGITEIMVMLVLYVVASGVAGLIIGRLVDASIGWD